MNNNKTRLVTFEPGDCTRYTYMLTYTDTHLYVTVLAGSLVQGGMVLCIGNDYIDYTYAMEKLRMRQPNVVAYLYMIRTLGYEIGGLPSGYDHLKKDAMPVTVWSIEQEGS